MWQIVRQNVFSFLILQVFLLILIRLFRLGHVPIVFAIVFIRLKEIWPDIWSTNAELLGSSNAKFVDYLSPWKRV